MRRQLVLVFVAVSALIAIAFIVPLALLVQRTAEDRAIDAGRADAEAVVPAVATGSAPPVIAATMNATASGQAGFLTVVTTDGVRLGADSAGSMRLDDAIADGTSAIGPVSGGSEVVIAVATGSGGVAAIRAFVPDSRLHQGRNRAWLALGMVGVVLVAISVVVADRLSRSVVRPTQRLAAAAVLLGGGKLDTQVAAEGPRELVELSVVFNQLGSRIETMLEHERELVADLSHRLRTPLTRLRLRVDQVADHQLAVELAGDVEELTSVVSGLILEARNHISGVPGRSEVTQLLSDRADFWSVLAEDQQREWRLVSPTETAWVAVGEPELAAAIDVLIENVFSHTDEGVAVEIGASTAKTEVRIWVDDGGTGFSESALSRGSSGQASTGLGLDIARQTAAAAGGQMELRRSVLGGARVELIFPTMGQDVHSRLG